MNRVLFLILGLDFSGAETVLLQYLENNEEVDPYFAFIYNGKASTKFKNYYEENKIIELNIYYDKNELRFIPRLTQYRLAKKINPIIKKLDPDVIYFNNTHEVLLSCLVKKQTSIPCIGHIHDMRESIGTFFKRHEVERAFKMLNSIITVSDACKKSWNCNKMQVVYNGVKDCYFKADNVISGDEVITVGFVGMLSQRKGFDILTTVIEWLDIQVNWKIAYNKVEKQYENTLRKLKSKSNVQIFNNIPESNMKNFYDKLDILLIPSRQDPLPTVAIEAMARRVLVLGANTGGIPELVGGKEFLFETDNINTIKKCILKYIGLKNTELKYCSDKQYSRADKMFRNSTKKRLINNIILESMLKEGEKE